MKNLGWTYDYQ